MRARIVSPVSANPVFRRGCAELEMKSMRIALVSPYSWTYPGGVTRHVEALAEQFRQGHEVRVLAPYDPPDRLSRAAASRCAPAGARAARLAGLARPHGRLPGQRGGLEPVVTPYAHRHAAPRAARRRLRRRPRPRAGRPARRLGRARLDRAAARRHVPHLLGQRVCRTAIADLIGRAAQAQPPARADRRLRGRRVDRPALLRRPLPDRPQRRRPARRACPARDRGPGRRCGSRSSARRSSARACRCCCARSRRCASTSPPSCRRSAPSREEVEPMLLDDRGVTVLGQGRRRRQARARSRAADVLCAPSLGGESFGMVLTEAFAAGTPVVASDIAGYRDVVRDGVDGVLVPRGDATALAEALRDLALEPARRAAMARPRRASARALRVAARRRRGARRLRGRDRRAGARHGGRARAVVVGALPADAGRAVPAAAAAEPRRRKPEPARDRRRRRAPAGVAWRRAGRRRCWRWLALQPHRPGPRSAPVCCARGPSWVLAGSR